MSIPVIPILIFILMIGIVIFVHELGHYLTARRAGIFVEEFALGMGPKIISRNGKKKNADGETTLYSLRMFPIGGFCRMRGMDEEMPDDKESLNNKSIPARMSVMAGGSFMNFALAFVLFFIFMMYQGTPLPETHEVYVRGVAENMPASVAGLMTNDVITHVNGMQIHSPNDVISFIVESEGQAVEMRVNRDGEVRSFLITPEMSWNEERETYVYMVGFSPASRMDFRRAYIHEGLFNAGKIFLMQITAPVKLLMQILQGETLAEGEGVMGLVGIGGVVTEYYNITIQRSVGDMILTMVSLTGVISGAVGFMNILPIPALDGGRIVFLLIEAIRKKRIHPEKEAMVHMVGLVALMLLGVFITYREIVGLIPGLNDYPG
jgi:regulator of sigma E protease